MADTGLPQSNVSGHLACLRDCGLVAGRQQWRHVYYRVADERVEDLPRVSDSIVAATAERLYACLAIDEPSQGCA